MERYGTERLYFVNRNSLLSHEMAARYGVDPANALLTYATGDRQTRQVRCTAGLNLACGFLDADRRSRNALVYDLMELALPAVGERVLCFYAPTRVPKSCVQ